MYDETALSAMSCVDSSVVSSSALRVLARSDERVVFFSSSRRRYFSMSFLLIRTALAAVEGIR